MYKSIGFTFLCLAISGSIAGHHPYGADYGYPAYGVKYGYISSGHGRQGGSHHGQNFGMAKVQVQQSPKGYEFAVHESGPYYQKYHHQSAATDGHNAAPGPVGPAFGGHHHEHERAFGPEPYQGAVGHVQHVGVGHHAHPVEIDHVHPHVQVSHGHPVEYAQVHPVEVGHNHLSGAEYGHIHHPVASHRYPIAAFGQDRVGMDHGHITHGDLHHHGFVGSERNEVMGSGFGGHPLMIHGPGPQSQEFPSHASQSQVYHSHEPQTHVLHSHLPHSHHEPQSHVPQPQSHGSQNLESHGFGGHVRGLF